MSEVKSKKKRRHLKQIQESQEEHFLSSQTPVELEAKDTLPQSVPPPDRQVRELARQSLIEQRIQHAMSE